MLVADVNKQPKHVCKGLKHDDFICVPSFEKVLKIPWSNTRRTLKINIYFFTSMERPQKIFLMLPPRTKQIEMGKHKYGRKKPYELKTESK